MESGGKANKRRERVPPERTAVPARTLLRWAGSKRRAISDYDRLMPPSVDCYVEPFAGSAAIFFHRQPARAVLGDLNRDLIATYDHIVDSPTEVYGHYNFYSDAADDYYRAREAFNRAELGHRKAGLFLYLNRLCFNGLYRTNNRGEFNVPYGGVRTTPRLSLADIEGAATLLGRATLIAGDFERVIYDYGDGSSFFFIDPPYFTSTKRIFREYGSQQFAEMDLGRLQSSLSHLDAVGAKFLLSYADVPEARRMLAAWRCETIEVTRHIAGFGGARRRERELIATNFCTSPAEDAVG